MLKNILFDLDGTLLPMDQEKFVNYYLPLLAERFAKKGIQPDMTIHAVWKGVGAMVGNDGSMTNEARFWESFESDTGVPRSQVEADTLDFYANEFNRAIVSTEPTQLSARIISALKTRGFHIYLATNPIFPRVATENRIRWAGLSPDNFEAVTTYENCRYCKPNPLYYSEFMKEHGLLPEECLMVGNDVSEDLSIRTLGVPAYLVTDCLENKRNLPLDAEFSGSLQNLYDMILTHKIFQI